MDKTRGVPAPARGSGQRPGNCLGPGELQAPALQLPHGGSARGYLQTWALLLASVRGLPGSLISADGTLDPKSSEFHTPETGQDHSFP